ncbi:hypothetical protein ID0987_13380 [Helicobacter pylori]
MLSQFKGQNDEKVSHFIFNKRVGVNGVIERMDALTTPLNWQKIRLGDIAEIKRGVRITKNELDVFGKYPVVSGGVGFLGYTNNFN